MVQVAAAARRLRNVTVLRNELLVCCQTCHSVLACPVQSMKCHLQFYSSHHQGKSIATTLTANIVAIAPRLLMRAQTGWMGQTSGAVLPALPTLLIKVAIENCIRAAVVCTIPVLHRRLLPVELRHRLQRRLQQQQQLMIHRPCQMMRVAVHPSMMRVGVHQCRMRKKNKPRGKTQLISSQSLSIRRKNLRRQARQVSCKIS